jgi:glucose/mannose transport system substrate-binding protein
MWKMTKIAAVVAVGMAAAMSASAGEVEVLHYWTSGGGRTQEDHAGQGPHLA